MNNTVENHFFEFPKVNWLHLVKWTNLSNLLRIYHSKNRKSRLIFDRVIQKMKRWTFLEQICIINFYISLWKNAKKIAISLQQYDHLHKIWHNDAERVSRIHQLSKLTFKNPRWRTADALETSRLVDLQDDGL